MAADGRETEIKLAVPDAASTLTLLGQQGFNVLKPRVFESNILYDTEDGKLKARKSTVRLRRAGQNTILTFKGPAETGLHKSRDEFETLVSDFENAQKILDGLGYLPKFRYEKYRTELGRDGADGVITVDETPIGCFMELEGAGEWIDRVAQELGFTPGDYLTLSYAALYKRHCEANGVIPTHMVFPTA